MSTKAYLKKQTQTSLKEGRTRPALRRLIFSAVGKTALRGHYGENYGNRCIQSASAVERLLRRCGIDCLLVQGEACIGHVHGSRLSWTSFGGSPDRFHYWTQTRFGELVDFTVRQQHLAPGVEPGGVPCPALWWNNAGSLPGPFQYLPGPKRGRIAVSLHDPEEERAFERFIREAGSVFEALLRRDRAVGSFETVSSDEDLNRLSKAGDPWASQAWKFQDLPLPAWAERRREELLAPYSEHAR